MNAESVQIDDIDAGLWSGVGELFLCAESLRIQADEIDSQIDQTIGFLTAGELSELSGLSVDDVELSEDDCGEFWSLIDDDDV